MQVNFTLSVILNGGVIFLGFFSAIGLFIKKENRLPNKLMAFFIAAISFWLCDNFMRIAGIYSQDPNYYFKPIYYSFAFGPLLYFYVMSIVNSDFRFKRVDLLHFIPVIMQALLYLILTFQTYEDRLWYWQEVHLPYTYRIEFDGTFISMAVYLFFSIRHLRKYQSWLNNEHSDLSTKKLNWLKAILMCMLILCGQWFFEAVLRDVYEVYYDYNFTPTILGLLTLILAYYAFFQKDQKDIVFIEDLSWSKTSDVSFDPDITQKLIQRMTNHKDYLDSKLSLKEFSSRCKLPQKTVSQHLNHQINKTFHDFVNEFRVEEFKSKVSEIENSQLTLEGLAYDCGFNSKATFNRIFKKFTGTTPSKFVSKQGQ